MKKLSIARLTEKEKAAIEILKREYNVKTASGAARIAFVRQAEMFKSMQQLVKETNKNQKK